MKRVLTIILIITLIFSMFQYSATAASDVCFIAINETLLDLGTVPYFYGSMYVPYSVFSNFSIYSAYFSSGNTISLYRSDKQLYFDMNTGKVYDGKDNYYSTTTIKSSGELYVSVQFVCNFFGLSWSYIEGVGYGDVLRITDGGNYLSDSAFLSAATTLMQSRYESYIAATTVVPTEKPVTPEPPELEAQEDEEISYIYLSFEGIPTADLLSTLSVYGTKVVFYITAQEMLEAPDMLRRVLGEGHRIGIYCTEDFAVDYARGSEILFDATGYSTLMISSSAAYMYAGESFASANGLCYNSYDLDLTLDYSYSQMTAMFAALEGICHVRYDCSENTRQYIGSILTYFRNGDFYLAPEREV